MPHVMFLQQLMAVYISMTEDK